MKKPITLDRIDLKILDVLKQDGRISFQKLSELVNLTHRPCLERVRQLERAGIIKGYTAIIDIPSTERPVIVIAQIALIDHARSQTPFEQELRKTEAVLDCWLVSGTFDFLVRLACRDMEHYRTLTTAWLESKEFKIDKILTNTELQIIKRT